MWGAEKVNGEQVLKIKTEGFLLYLRFLKVYHQKGFVMSTDGVCNPVTLIKAVSEVVIGGVRCGVGIIRERGEKSGLEALRQKLIEKVVGENTKKRKNE